MLILILKNIWVLGFWPVISFSWSEKSLYCSCTHFLFSWWSFPFPCWYWLPDFLQCYQIWTLWFIRLQISWLMYCCNLWCGFCCEFLGYRSHLCLFLFSHFLFSWHFCCRAWWFPSCIHNVNYIVRCNFFVDPLF